MNRWGFRENVLLTSFTWMTASPGAALTHHMCVLRSCFPRAAQWSSSCFSWNVGGLQWATLAGKGPPSLTPQLWWNFHRWHHRLSPHLPNPLLTPSLHKFHPTSSQKALPARTCFFSFTLYWCLPQQISLSYFGICFSEDLTKHK